MISYILQLFAKRNKKYYQQYVFQRELVRFVNLGLYN